MQIFTASCVDASAQLHYRLPIETNNAEAAMTDEEIKQALKDLEEIEVRKAANKERAKR